MRRSSFSLRNLIILISHVILLTLNGYAQKNLNSFHHLSTPTNKFSLNSITSIAQDKLGFMWFGTRKGVFRYDGVVLKNMTSINKYLDSLGKDDVISLLCDQQGLLWICSNNGIEVYDPIYDTFITSTTLESGVTEPIFCILQMTNGDFIIGTRHSLFQYNKETDALNEIQLVNSYQNEYGDQRVSALCESSDGKLWVGAKNGLYLFAVKEGEVVFDTLYQHQAENQHSLIHNEIYALIEDKNGQLWVGTSEGLDRMPKDEERFIHYNQEHQMGIVNNYVRAFTLDHQQRLWIGTFDGISVIDTNGVETSIKHDVHDAESLSDNKIRALYTDQSGCIWIGTYYGGVNYWNDVHTNFYHLEDRFKDKLSYEVISAIEESPKGIIYLGTEGDGVAVLDAGTRRINYINCLEEDVCIGTVKSLFLDGNTMFIGTFEQGLFKYNLVTKQYKQYLHDDQDSSSMGSNTVLGICKYDDTHLWIGTLGGGLGFFDLQSETFLNFKSNYRKRQSLLNNSPRCLRLDNQRNLWIGSGKGLVVLKNEDFIKKKYVFNRKSIDGKVNFNVFDIQKDANGTIWIATDTEGLMSIKNDELTKGTLSTEKVYSIIAGDFPELWLSTNLGIVRYNSVKGQSRIYGLAHGVKINEFTRSARLFSQTGEVFFGGTSGVTAFDPGKIRFDTAYKPEVKLVGLSIYEKPVVVGDETGILSQTIEYTKEISLAHNQNMIALTYAFPDYIYRYNNTFEYRLVGFNESWVKTNANAVIYTLQKPGSYTFELRHVARDDVADNEPVSLEINLLPPFWKSWWAYMFYMLIFVGGLVASLLLIQSRTRLRHRLALESKEHQHKQNLNEQKLQFFTHLSHDFRTPLTLIIGSLQRGIEDYKGSHKVYQRLLSAQKNANKLFKLVNELLDFRKLEEKKMKITAAERDLISFLKEIFTSFEELAIAKDITYRFKSSDDLILIYIDKNKLERAFYNVSSNAFKYTEEGGEIEVAVIRKGQSAEVTVSDTGLGIAEEHLSRVFDVFYEVDKNKNNAADHYGTGIGLTIVKHIVALHYGKVSVHSEEGRGSTFSVNIPLGKKHFSDDELSNESSVIVTCTDSAKTKLLDVDKVLNGDGHKHTILVVEDNPEILSFLDELLTDYFHVTKAVNGVMALKEVSKSQPDLILSDVMMPEMDGIELCKRIKTNPDTSHIPFMLLTAKTSDVFKYGGLESGADEYIVKPFDPKALVLKCVNILKTRAEFRQKLLTSTYTANTQADESSLDEKMLKKALEIVDKNISNEYFGIPEFCEALAVGRAVLFYKIKAWSGKTPNELIQDMRMKKAAQHMSQKRYRMSEIASLVGFRDASYFSKSFKKHHGISPRAYAKKFGSEE